MSLRNPVPRGTRDHPSGWRPYVWRDPARVTPERAALLAALDAQDPGQDPGPAARERTRRPRAGMDALRLEFARHRAAGLTVPEAARAAGIATTTARRWDAQQRQAMTP